MQPSRQNSKARTLSLVLQNPEFARTLKEAWDAPFGSTKREQAKSVLNIMKKTQPSFEQQDLQDTSVPNENPWISLPAHTPVLNYAQHAPARGEKVDGQGGPGPGFIGPQLNAAVPPTPATPIAPVSIPQQPVLQPWQQGGPTQGLIPQAANWIGEQYAATPGRVADAARGTASVLKSVLAADAAVLGGAQAAISKGTELYHRAGAEIIGGDKSKIVPATPYSKTYGAQAANWLASQDVGEGALAKKYPTLFGPSKPTTSAAKSPETTQPTDKQILKDKAGKLYKWDGKTATYISNPADIAALVKQGYEDSRWDLASYTDQKGPTKPSAISGPVSGPTQTTPITGSQIQGSTGTQTYNVADPYAGAFGYQSSTSGTGTTGTGTTTAVKGSYGALNNIPGLDINAPENQGLSMTEYESKALNALSHVSDADWEAAFPGQPKPFGADLVGQTQKLIDVKKNELGLDQMQKQLTQMLSENPTFALDARDYIVAQDQQLKAIDPLLRDAQDQLANNSDFPLLRAMNTNYVNYLATMKGKTVQRYATYLNKAVDVRNVQVTQLQTSIANAQQELNMAIPMIQAKTSQDYSRIAKIIDENWQKPALAAQAEAQRVKDQNDLKKTWLDTLKTTLEIEKLGGGSQDDYTKNKAAIISAVTDPNTKGWNPAWGITDTIQRLAPGTPSAAYDAMKSIMTSSLMSPEKTANNETAPGLFNKQKMIESYENAVGSHYADLSNQAAQLNDAWSKETDPVKKQQYSDAYGQVNSQIAQLRTAQTGIGGAIATRLNENFTGVDDAMMSKIRDFFVQTKGIIFKDNLPADFSDSRKRDFVKEFGGTLTPDVANWVFDTVKRNTEASASLHGAKTADARFYFDAHALPGGGQVPAATGANLSNDVFRYIMADFGVTNLMDSFNGLSARVVPQDAAQQ